jgi:hypothetical protein
MPDHRLLGLCFLAVYLGRSHQAYVTGPACPATPGTDVTGWLVRLGWRWAVRPGQCDLDDVLGRGRRSIQQVGTATPRTTAVLDSRPHTQKPAPSDSEQELAYSLHPDGQAEACPEPSNQVSNNRHRQRRTPTDADGRSFRGQACRSAGSSHRDLASGRRGYRLDRLHRLGHSLMSTITMLAAA